MQAYCFAAPTVDIYFRIKALYTNAAPPLLFTTAILGRKKRPTTTAHVFEIATLNAMHTPPQAAHIRLPILRHTISIFSSLVFDYNMMNDFALTSRYDHKSPYIDAVPPLYRERREGPADIGLKQRAAPLRFTQAH